MPLTSPALTELNLESGSKALLNEWLKLWFDGATHVVGTNTTILFPRALISFDEGKIQQPLDPETSGATQAEIRIVCQPLRESTCWYDKTEWLKTCDVQFVFDVRASVREAGSGNSQLLVNQISELLFAILGNPASRINLAQKGFRFLRPKKPEPVQDPLYLHRVVRCAGKLTFSVKF